MASSLADIVRNPYALVQAAYDEGVAAAGARGGDAPASSWPRGVARRLATAVPTDAHLAQVRGSGDGVLKDPRIAWGPAKVAAPSA